MFEQDYIMRMIKDMTRVMLAIAGKRTSSQYSSEELEKVTISGGSLLEEQIRKMVAAGQINEAENLLTEELDLAAPADFSIAVSFYRLLNDLDEDTLTRCNYTREEIFEGLQYCADKFGIDPVLLEGFSI